MIRHLPISLSEEVREALSQNKGIVALESTLIAHGLPYPDNLKVAFALEEVIRQQGAVPATIAIIDGTLCVGMDKKQIERLTDPKAAVKKISRRDIAYAITAKETGATTISSTMIAAKLAGVKFFATGGLGGVHRGVEQTLDISSDLIELSRTEVAVVCAGAKSILDIPKTLEMLEMLGVPVFGYRTEYFPEFYCAGKHFPLEMQLDSPKAIAETLKMHWALGLSSGVVIAQPVVEDKALPKALVEEWIGDALKEANRDGIEGKHITPFLLKKIATKSDGKAIRTNCALVIENARLAASIAALF